MSTNSRLALAAAATLGLSIALAACRDQAPAPTGPSVVAQHAEHSVVADAEVNRWLAQLRRATAPFQRLEAAADAGWSEPITGCMELPGTGGMGYHYGNPGLIDGTPEDIAPELLVYEPQKNGRLRLVAVEYIVPFDLWTETAPPSLHGVDFHRNEAFGLWVLHAWVWKHNPAGIFEDWNPEANCDFAFPEQEG